MDRREHLKLLLAGTAGAGLFLATSCSEADVKESLEIIKNTYGRTPEELERDRRLHSETFFTDFEREVVGILSDIIIPADGESVSATETGVVDFIEFMMKDFPFFQIPTRGGIMWLNNQCRSRFGSNFPDCSHAQRMEVIDDIAWPDKATPEMEYGVRFFNRMRNLAATGFFTSKEGIEYLGYMGNRPYFWDGVPENVLKKHGLSYDEKTLRETIKEKDRYTVPQWDEKGNIIG